MKPTTIYRGDVPDLILPDHLADWDVWDYWERERYDSMAAELGLTDRLWIAGAEHGALAALWSRLVGSVVLVEPSPPFWRNIRLTWEANNLERPAASVSGFLGDESNGSVEAVISGWPRSAHTSDEECPAQEYRYLFNEKHVSEIGTATIDELVTAGVPAPTALSLDTEGAEVLILPGAKRTLSENDVLVWVSVHPDLIQRDYAPHSAREVRQFMTSLGYTGKRLAIDHEEHWLFRR